MLREFLGALAVVTCIASTPGCSLILDFSDQAGVHDAALDGPYTAAECTYKEPNDSIDTAAMITVADTGPAAICKNSGSGAAEDDDFYLFTVPAGTTKVTIAAMFTARPGGDLDMRLYDASSAVVAQSRGFGDNETLICPASSPACPTLTAADYIFEIFPAMPGNLNDYTFSLTLE
jgi:hypothetical protein